MNTSVSLYDSYLCKETRLKKQQQLLKKYACPVITLKAHMPRELRHNNYVTPLIAQGLEAIQHTLSNHGMRCISNEEFQSTAGLEHYLAVKCRSASELKKLMMNIESQHYLGQLLDINVMNSEGKTLSRGSCELSARKCIICDQIAPVCAKNHRHSNKELDKQIRSMMDSIATEI
ncbi:citrate lyase holo-[acyl-carrier protein] synthase [Vibrio sp. TH_r3]|uniref:citrate lyase holo-[acyl-carrier protein] synthase n=1 Tax=Vibrio sp. TH_r3 TaxID=3082084 RepID=UPI002955D227|nr:citrate lyase holo-[acyl-carrier protein] synthase [Vibrio sp. TH_r3]MDV7103418.1 citrate lyase holo-[acyl-carrier protein] synthase [Vibrio sp. TH_r3]